MVIKRQQYHSTGYLVSKPLLREEMMVGDCAPIKFHVEDRTMYMDYYGRSPNDSGN